MTDEEKRIAAVTTIAQIAATLEAGDRSAGPEGLGVSTPEFYVGRAARLYAAAETQVFAPSAEPE